MNVYQKLNAARAKFHSLQLKKTGKNTFAGYNYFELGDFLIPALKVFEEVGLCATISFGKETAKLCVVNVDKPDEYIPFESPMGSAALKGCHEVQNIGAVETYQRRYLWVAALEIVEHDALDATTGKAEPEKKEKPKTGVKADYLSQHPPIAQERQDELDELALLVKDDLSAYGAQAAFERLQGVGLEDVEKIYLSTRLTPAEQRAIKEYSQAFHKKVKEPA